MTGLHALIRRNCKLFFKDKGMFITSLITPAVLLVLYTTFLAGVYRDAFTSSLPSNLTLDSKLLGGLVGGQLVSSLLAVSCVTVAFCSNMLMVQDKVTGARRDLQLTPVKPATMALGYYCATLCSTLWRHFGRSPGQSQRRSAQGSPSVRSAGRDLPERPDPAVWIHCEHKSGRSCPLWRLAA